MEWTQCDSCCFKPQTVSPFIRFHFVFEEAFGFLLAVMAIRLALGWSLEHQKIISQVFLFEKFLHLGQVNANKNDKKVCRDFEFTGLQFLYSLTEDQNSFH